MAWETKRYPAYYGGVKQAYPHIAPGESFYSRSVVVGNLVFLSAVSPRSIDTGKMEASTLEEQVFAALDNIRVAMEEAGSSMNNVIKNTILVKNMEDVSRVRETELKYCQKYAPLLAEEPPASSIIITNLEAPEYLVQIDALGVISRGEPGWEMRTYPAYYGGIKQAYPHVAPGQPMFSRSAVVGNLIFCSGANARSLVTGEVETDNFEEQMVIALDKVRMNMEQAGGSLNNVIKTLVYFKDIGSHYTSMRKIESEYYQKNTPSLAENPPASTVCQAHLEKPEYLVEIDALGIVSKNKPGWEMKKYPAYYGGIKYAYPHVPPGHPLFSRSAVVGNLLFCSGAAGLALGTFKQASEVLEDQMKIVMDKIKMYLEQAGSSMENIVKMVIYLKNMDDCPRIRKAELEYYQTNAPALVGEPPASTVIEARLHEPETLMEIEAIGVIPE